MNQYEFVIFAELNRDHFEEILQTLTRRFDNIESGRQGDEMQILQQIDDDGIIQVFDPSKIDMTR